MRITCQRIGLPPISTSALGIACVCSWSLVPRPPQRMATGTPGAAPLPDPACGLAATGHGGQDRHLVAVAELGVEAVPKADVLAGDVDVDESPQGPVLGDPLAQLVMGVE